jgi:hypothetical protein
METFPIVKRKDETQHGEYRTRRVILEMHNAMQSAIDTGELYQSRLDPPPWSASKRPALVAAWLSIPRQLTAPYVCASIRAMGMKNCPLERSRADSDDS